MEKPSGRGLPPVRQASQRRALLLDHTLRREAHYCQTSGLLRLSLSGSVRPDSDRWGINVMMGLGAEIEDRQIKGRQRVRDLAEVFTHEREVNAILDLMPEMFPGDADGAAIKFLEPACGSGNFIEAILRRKLGGIRANRYRSVEGYEFRLLVAVASIYGIDIDSDNVEECRDRIEHVVRSHYSLDANTSVSTDGFDAALKSIVGTNILHADFLTHAERIEFIDYQDKGRCRFQRYWSPLRVSRPGASEQGELFSLEQVTMQDEMFPTLPLPRNDATPEHYSVIAAHRGPAPARTRVAR